MPAETARETTYTFGQFRIYSAKNTAYEANKPNTEVAPNMYPISQVPPAHRCCLESFQSKITYNSRKKATTGVVPQVLQTFVNSPPEENYL